MSPSGAAMKAATHIRGPLVANIPACAENNFQARFGRHRGHIRLAELGSDDAGRQCHAPDAGRIGADPDAGHFNQAPAARVLERGDLGDGQLDIVEVQVVTQEEGIAAQQA